MATVDLFILPPHGQGAWLIEPGMAMDMVGQSGELIKGRRKRNAGKNCFWRAQTL
jgi:hypothetical protein